MIQVRQPTGKQLTAAADTLQRAAHPAHGLGLAGPELGAVVNVIRYIEQIQGVSDSLRYPAGLDDAPAAAGARPDAAQLAAALETVQQLRAAPRTGERPAHVARALLETHELLQRLQEAAAHREAGTEPAPLSLQL